MTILLLYDIPQNRLRAKVADACLDYGLRRIQFSAFLGDLNRNRQQEILQRIKKLVGQEAARIQLVPVCEKDLRLMQEVITDGYKIERR